MDLFDYFDPPPAPPKVEVVDELPFQPRDYQQEAVDNAFALFPHHPGVIIRSPTGTGKTAIASFIADKWLKKGDDYRVLVLAHERQLIQQFSDEIRDILGNRYTIAIEMSNQHCTGKEDIIVASRQTLLVREAKDEFGNETTTSRLYKFDANKNWLVIFDECHRYLRKLKSVRGIIEHFEQNPNSKRLGVSATPERGCGTSLSGLFPGIASDYRMFDPDGGKCAVLDGWVVPYDQRFITVDSIDFKNIREVAKDFDESQLQEVLGEQETLAKMVMPMLDLVGNRQNIIFNAGTEIAKKVALYINAKAGKDIAVSLDGTYPDEIRKDIYRRFEAKEFQHLAVCGLCKEGYNNKSLSSVTIFRPTKSKVLCEQMRGRGCRVLSGVVTDEMTPDERRAAIAASAKPDCLAEGTPILTDVGLIPIESVTTTMRVWDGVEFVSHDGVLFKGVQDVIEYCGLAATSDHKVWTKNGWKEIGSCATEQTPVAITGNGWQAIRETDGHFARGFSSRLKERQAISADSVRMRNRGLEKLPLVNQRRIGMQNLWQPNHNSALAVSQGRGRKAAMHKSKESRIRAIWRAGDRISVFNSAGDVLLGARKSRIASQYGTRSNRQQRTLRSRQFAIRNASEKPEQYSRTESQCRVSRISSGASRDNLLRRHTQAAHSLGTVVGGDYRTNEAASSWSKASVSRKARVFDIINAGPRHRFTASGLLVSNCLVIDLVGATGLGDCASTAHIFANGKPDEVIERANDNMRKKPEEQHDVGEEIRRAEQEIAEEREKAKKEREERLRREREEMERRAKLAAEVKYQQRKVSSGHGAVGKGEKRKVSMPFGKHKGESIESLHTNYLKAFVEKMENLPYWLKGAINKELDKRSGKSEQPKTYVPHEAGVWDDVAALLRS